VRDALRRYPALAYLAGAAALAILLPSALVLPNSGPPTLAEYAPVTGDGEGVGDMSALGQAGSGGLGFSSGGRRERAAGGELDGTAGGSVRRIPGTKRCVGEPPRQTEDPLSPPCVAFFQGDNGGATSKGVTRDEVAVFIRGTRDAGTQRPTETDCGAAVTPDDDGQDHACKAFMRYFNERYQTYNRLVRFWLVRGDVTAHEEALVRRGVFASVSPYSAVSQAAKHRSLAVGYEGSSRESYRRYPGHVMTFRPDVEDEVGIAASQICLQLHGRKARYSGNPTDRDRERVFGLWHDDNVTVPQRLTQALSDTCGLTFAETVTRRDDASAPARLRSSNVTTVVVILGANYNVPPTLATNAAWFPEWVIPSSSGSARPDTNGGARYIDQTQWANAIGITFDYKRDDFTEQHWVRAYREGCPPCPDPTPSASAGPRQAPYLYDALTMLFWGIQAAGPKLTPENLDRGLHAIPPNRSTDPYKPAGYFDPGNWSFVKDATTIWWDPQGQPPGSGQPGCWRLPGGGQRYRKGEWPAGDGGLKAAGPCQGDIYPG